MASVLLTKNKYITIINGNTVQTATDAAGAGSNTTGG